jgi:hypothetical protein
MKAHFMVFCIGVSLIILSLAPSGVSQGVQELDTTMIRGINWGGYTAPELHMIGDTLHCNLVHVGVTDTLLHPYDVRSAHLKLILADGNNKLYKNTTHTLRMTVWPGAHPDGSNDSVFCFRTVSGYYRPSDDQIYARLFRDSLASFSNIQYARGQWFGSFSGGDSMHLTLKAKRTSSAGDSADVFFTVTVRHMKVIQDNDHPCGIIDSSDKHVFTFLGGDFPVAGFNSTEVSRTFTFDSTTQANEWGYSDSTDITVEWSGKGDVDWYWVRLECQHAYDYMLKGNMGTRLNDIHTRFTQINSVYDTLLFRVNDDDEMPPSCYEALGYHHFLLDSLATLDGTPKLTS